MGREWGNFELLGAGAGAGESQQKVEHLNRRTVERGKRLVGKNQASKIK